VQKRLTAFKKFLKLIKITNPRIKFVKLIQVVLVLTLIIRIVFIHHIAAADYLAYANKATDKLQIKKTWPRGVIYDTNEKALVTNLPVFSIIYQYDVNRSAALMDDTAILLAQMIEVDTSKLSNNCLREIYQQQHPEILSEDITNADLKTITASQKQAHVIFRKMAEARYGGENTLKFDANEIELARVVENMQSLPGVEIATQSIRKQEKQLFSPAIIGQTRSLDANFLTADFYKYRQFGYLINDQIGSSGIEAAYEDLLRGYQSRQELSETGDLQNLDEGIRGADLVLTIDNEFANLINDILEQNIRKSKNKNAGAKYLREGYVVAVNPKTGEILSLNGRVLDKEDNFFDNALGTFQNAFTMGSVIKGATLLTGYEYQVTNFGDTVNDTPMIFADGRQKASWKPLGIVDDIQALRSSSNVYFMQQAIKMGGDTYIPRANLNIAVETIATYRQAFAQYGLGIATGIALQSEQVGFKTLDNSIAKLLDFAIGQSDTYTPLQLASYIATIANGGNRLAMQLLKAAFIPISENEKQLIYNLKPQILNTIDLPVAAFDRVQEGFRQVLQHPEGTGYRFFKNSAYSPAGKTGTAEEFVRDEQGLLVYDNHNQLISVNHLTFVGYAPHNDPEIALAVVFPQASLPQTQSQIALEVANEIINGYFKLQKQRANR